MSIQQPNQYQCDNMEQGDIIFVKKRNPIYKLYRKLFMNNKPKINVIKDWTKPDEKVQYYQEDCILIYLYELKCVQSLNDEVPIVIFINNKPVTSLKIHNMEVSLYNLKITFKNGLSFVIPIDYIKNCLNKNDVQLKNLNNYRIVEQNLKFIRYKGDYFKKYVTNNNIQSWIPYYCSVCGKPVVFTFGEDVIDINNRCECKNLQSSMKHMTYDEFSIWYASETNNNTKSYYNKFWFKER